MAGVWTGIIVVMMVIIGIGERGYGGERVGGVGATIWGERGRSAVCRGMHRDGRVGGRVSLERARVVVSGRVEERGETGAVLVVVMMVVVRRTVSERPGGVRVSVLGKLSIERVVCRSEWRVVNRSWIWYVEWRKSSRTELWRDEGAWSGETTCTV